MNIILQCWSDHDDACGCDYALVDLDPKRARHLLKRHAAFLKFRKGTDACEASWWDYGAKYFSPWGDMSNSDRQVSPEATKRMEQALSAFDGGGDDIEVPDDFEVPDEMLARTECDQMVVRKDGVSFSCIPKHTDVHVTTGMILVEVIERVAAAVTARRR